MTSQYRGFKPFFQTNRWFIAHLPHQFPGHPQELETAENQSSNRMIDPPAGGTSKLVFSVGSIALMFQMKLMKFCGRLPVAILLIGGMSAVALAHSGAKGIVKQRMNAMGDIADQMKLLGGMVQGKAPFDADAIAKAAAAIAGHAAEIPGLFPEGSVDHPSEALPAIWTDWPRFEASAQKLAQDADALRATASTAAGPDDIKAPFGQMASNCKTCHEAFRLKK